MSEWQFPIVLRHYQVLQKAASFRKQTLQTFNLWVLQYEHTVGQSTEDKDVFVKFQTISSRPPLSVGLDTK